jgi:hypothetical protein
VYAQRSTPPAAPTVDTAAADAVAAGQPQPVV